MLFNSHAFICPFLPIVLGGFFLLARAPSRRRDVACARLTSACCLSSPMLESHLADIRRGREEWKLRHPVDVAEIGALGREGRERRERLRAIGSRP